MSKVVYLGKINFNWCDNCNVPVLGKKCNICNSTPRPVNVTPPGDFKFMMEGDKELLNKAFKNILKEDFSKLFNDRIVLMNRIPGQDRSEEIIVNGYVIATVIYDFEETRVALKPSFYAMMKNYLKDIFIQADPQAIESIKKGNNLMAPGVMKIGGDVLIGHDVFVLDDKNNAVALGISRISKNYHPDKGMAVKIKFLVNEIKIPNSNSDIKKVIDANKNYMESREEQSIKMIKRYDGKNVFVSFSGGKDSLVSLHLTIRSGIKFRTIFLNTGLEFKETVDYVKNIEEKFSLDLDIIDAGNAFYSNLDHFGPPGRDYRWCCKVCKLGPTTRYIKDHSNGQIFMIIGQRSYESKIRASKGEIWENSWVPNQIGISPIQNWNSLMIWIYIFEHGLEYNPWYDQGLWRTGCFLCPSQDLGDLAIVKENYDKYSDWEKFLKNYALKNNLPEIWVIYGLWRWNELPDNLKNRFNFNGFKRTSLEVSKNLENDYYEVKGNKNLDVVRLKNMMNIVPKNFYKIENKLLIHKNFIEQGIQVIYESQECVGCGICTGRCEVNALYLNIGKVWVNEEKCIHCTKCLGPCPAYNFR
ncbi:MAG: phosphoadenosine phosphosulfate reductase family protein [Thermoplasmata archaeon]